jgi:lysophospholipase L1-like esterase
MRKGANRFAQPDLGVSRRDLLKGAGSAVLCTLAILGAVVLVGPVAAHAQAPLPNAQMTDSPCPPPPPRPPQEMLAAMLKPGAKPPPMPSQGDEKLREYLKKHAEDLARDFPDLCHYKSDNAAIREGAHPTIIFMGDSITEGWGVGDPSLFSRGVVDRGISGQTSPQMLLRFYQDVVALRPRAVHIMAGTNDVAGNTGPSSPDDFKNNIRAMVDLARANHIQVVLASILPAERFPWRPDIQPVEQIRQLNAWLRQFAGQHELIYADYYSSLATPSGALRPELSNDGVHPNADGYAAMRPIADAAIRKAMHGSLERSAVDD